MNRLSLAGLLITLCTVAGGVLIFLFLPRVFNKPICQVTLAFCLLLGVPLFFVGLHASGVLGRNALDRTALALAVAAIVFACWQFVDSRLQERRLETLADEMSTRSLGLFPKDMDDINQVVTNSNRSLDIMTDFVGYGHFSAPDQFARYLGQLQRLGPQVRLLVYTVEKGQRVHNLQFTATEVQ
jgi:hypothetical protein